MRRIAYSLQHMILNSIEQFTDEKKLGQSISRFANMAEISKRKDFQLYPDDFPPKIAENLKRATLSYDKAFYKKIEVAIDENIGYYH